MGKVGRSGNWVDELVVARGTYFSHAKQLTFALLTHILTQDMSEEAETLKKLSKTTLKIIPVVGSSQILVESSEKDG
jgi:hypothetical protein